MILILIFPGPGRRRMFSPEERHSRKLESARRSREKRSEMIKLMMEHVKVKEQIYESVMMLKQNIQHGLTEFKQNTESF